MNGVICFQRLIFLFSFFLERRDGYILCVSNAALVSFVNNILFH